MNGIHLRGLSLILFFMIFIIMMIPSWPASTSNGPQGEKNILILHSYHKGLGWTDDQNDGMIQTFRQLGLAPMFHIEYMDWKYNPTPDNLRLRQEQYRLRYADKKIDLILTTDDAALTFALKNRQELFSGAPIIFSGVLKESAQKLTQNQVNITGVFEKFDAAGTIRLMRRFDPALQWIYLLYDNTESGLQAAKVMTDEAYLVDPQLQLIHLNTTKFSNIIQTLGSLSTDSHSAALINTYSRDVDGMSMEMERFVNFFSESSTIPIYILYDFDSNHGAVGGSLAVGRHQGELAAQLGVRVLNGENPNALPPLESAGFITSIDYTQMLKRHLPLEKIPADAQVINQPPTFYERYREVILAITVLFLVMSLFIILLMLSIRNRIQSEKKLTAARTYLDKIIDSVADPIVVKDSSLRWVLVNQSFADFTARRREDLLGKTAQDIFRPAEAALHHQQDAEVLATGEERIYISPIQDAQGNQRVIEAKKTRYVDPQGVSNVVAVLRDVTVIKQAEEILKQANEDLEEKIVQRTGELAAANTELAALNKEIVAMNESLQTANQTMEEEVHERRRMELVLQRALQELQQTQNQLIQSGKLAALGSLVAGVAHEINTPLGNSVTAASCLRISLEEFSERTRGPAIDRPAIHEYLADQQDGLFILEANLRRAVELVRSFKNVATDQMQEIKHVFNVHQSLSDIILTLRPCLKKTRLQLTLDCPEDLEWNSYPGILSQIITNLITNSVVHAYEPQQEGRISLKMFRGDGEMVLDYADDGNGMTDEVLKKIFDPFFTTKRGQGSTGLGMYIVYNLVTQKLGGTIQCASTPGSGSHFLVRMSL